MGDITLNVLVDDKVAGVFQARIDDDLVAQIGDLQKQLKQAHNRILELDDIIKALRDGISNRGKNGSNKNQ